MFSNTVMRGKIEVIWKLRDSPRWLISCGARLAIDRPLTVIEPELIGKRPEIRLNSVVLPAPLGPMMAWRSPRGIERLTPRMISVAPNFLHTSRSSTAGTPATSALTTSPPAPYALYLDAILDLGAFHQRVPAL